ncbi:MAG: glycosyltransferase family 2 protein, partial [Bacteroidia bacterium]|nr:glycosyltransferase family 2 protein [Bacteroidia bacterium]
MFPVTDYPEGVSLIICSYNGSARISQALEYIQQQVVPNGIPWEVILVDNASQDNTADVASRSWKLDIPFKIVSEPQPGLMFARNRGVSEAAFEFISFIDDDNLVSPDWVNTVYHTFTGNAEISMCGGQNRGMFEVTPPAWISGILNTFAVGKQADNTRDITDIQEYLWGAGLSLRKSAYNQIYQTGFTPLLKDRSGTGLGAGGDQELCLAFRLCGFRLWYIDTLEMEHVIPEKRFEWNYVINMFKGFGRAEFVFELYRMEIRKRKTPFFTLYLGLIPYSIIYFGWRLVNLPRNMKYNVRYLSYL